MKRKNLLLILLASSGLLFGLSNNGGEKLIHAEEHSHTYVDNTCSCGSHLFEAEEGIVTGVNSSTGTNDGFIASANSNNPAHPTSGVKVVRYWGKQGNKITWRFALDEKANDVTIRLWAGAKSTDLSTNNLAFTLNDTNAKWERDTLNTVGTYLFYFAGTEAKCNFAKGNNELILENKSDIAFNIDCIEIEFPNTVHVTSFVEGDPLGEVDGKGETGGTSVGGGNKLHIEAEHATRIVGTPAHGNPGFVEEDPACSNGACVCNWGNEGDNIISFDFYSSKDVSSATFTISICSSAAAGTRLDGMIIPRINGGSGGAPAFHLYPGVEGIDIESSGTYQGSTSWSDYSEFKTPSVSLKEGKNTFELESFNSIPVNIDYIVIESNEDVSFSFTPTDHGVGGQPGVAILEAEAGIIKGTSSDPDSEMILVRSSSNPQEHETSGGACVGNFATVGNSITWNFSSSSAVSSFKLSLWVASCFKGGETSNIISLKLNDKELTFDQSTFPAFPGGELWYKWVELTVSNASIDEGMNKLVLTNTSGSSFNVDCIILNVPDDCYIRSKNVDAKAPELSIIYLTSKELEKGKTIVYTYTYSDDITSNANLKITENVYYEFGTSKQQTIQVNNHSFVASKGGTYTIIVKIKDESGNETTRRRYVVIPGIEDEPEEEPNHNNPDQPSPNEPNNPNGGVVVKTYDKKLIGGWITFAAGLGVSIALIGCMVILSKKRA